MVGDIMTKFLLRIMESYAYRALMKYVMPYIRFSFYYTSFRGDKYHEGYQHLQKGMVIGTIDYKKATGILIPKVTGGILSHIGYCVGKRDPQNINKNYATVRPIMGQGSGLEIVEMTHLDFTFSDFFDLCKEAERVIIFDCVDWSDEYRDEMIYKALELKYARYDSAFSLGIKSLYCSELVYQADLAAGGGIQGRLKCNIEDIMGLGQPYISPDGLLCADNVRVVWDSKGEFTGLTGPEVKKLVFREKL